MSVIFDQLRISDDGKQLFINAHVNRATPFNNINIKKVMVTEASKVSETMSMDTLIENGAYLKVEEFNPSVKEVNLVYTINDLMRHDEEDVKKINFCQGEMSSTLFFVYIQTEGNVPAECECLPCSLQRNEYVGVTFDEGAFYQKVMNYTRELAQDCETMPKGFVDFILQWNAFKTSVETEHFLPAIKFYNLMFGNASSPGVYTSTKGCGCHGRSRL